MKFCNMAVVVPVDQLTGSKAALSAQVWGQVSNLLMPALGKLYRQFHPANDAWGHKLTSPFGVVLGCQEPELMIHALWHISLQKGAPLPDCGIYYAALGRAVASQEEQRAILSNPAGYALCVVRLSPEVEKDDCI